MGAELFHVEKRLDGRTYDEAFPNFAKAPINLSKLNSPSSMQNSDESSSLDTSVSIFKSEHSS